MGLTAQVLRNMPKAEDPNLIVGTETFDDAGVYRLNATTALVQTVDFFPPLVDDAYTFGRIAAANSLSDVYAMGGRPLTALNIVAFPDKDLPGEILAEILRGGAERVSAAGAIIVGGHSVRDAEIKYGLAVTGLVNPDAVVTNAGARPGDDLVLTKPIGSGTMTTAAKKGVIPEADLAEAIAVMTELNAGGAEAMCRVGVHAATDVTGFGLLGHAFEMAEGSGVTLQIEATAAPLMRDALRLAGEGVATRAWKSNAEHLGGQLDRGVTPEALLTVLCDAQTSGGLLISVPSERTPRLLEALRRQRTPCAAVIGRVLARQEAAIMLR
ncbi:MAG: selenide, water dikinase [Planctomycetota bacterium]|nr:MAG: selenide, water dikinase [Planctomycetota bacterium]